MKLETLVVGNSWLFVLGGFQKCMKLSEDDIGLVQLDNSTAETMYTAIKDALLRYAA